MTISSIRKKVYSQGIKVERSSQDHLHCHIFFICLEVNFFQPNDISYIQQNTNKTLKSTRTHCTESRIDLLESSRLFAMLSQGMLTVFGFQIKAISRDTISNYCCVQTAKNHRLLVYFGVDKENLSVH